ncbi:kinase-like domain-containing protein [Pelagophyceae sp. CCMP2097]|nr:kinase-like domain-containing protein [Pelagophyceae sp. CCMP2097]|mmetsp:Transcript_22722/g.76778  ORF Transcript_22722/g.76778 Transcript_22722/m.76778 type:complete len:458 (+) Transcript_22722:62-1435(+)
MDGVAWYHRHIAAAAGGNGGDSEAVVADLWALLEAAEADGAALYRAATAVLGMPWNAHLAGALLNAGYAGDAQTFEPMPSRAALLAVLNRQGAGANPMPFPRPQIGAGRIERNVAVTSDRGQHVMDSVLVVSPELAYAFVANLQTCIYGKVRHGIQLKPATPASPRASFFAPRGTAPRPWCVSDVQVAIKCIERGKYEAHMERHRGQLNEDPIKEIAVMQYIGASGGAPHVLPLSGCYADEKCVYVVLPFCPNSDLFNLVEAQEEAMTESAAFHYFKQVMDGLDALHGLGLAHHDMSLENLMLDQRRSAVIIDFGMAVKMARKRPGLDGAAGGAVPLKPGGGWPCRCGKLLYMAPELFTPKNAFDVCAADLWACGIILFILLTRIPPWDPGVGPSDSDMRYVYVRDGRLRDLLAAWRTALSDDVQDLLQRLLTADPARRITLQEVRRHPWWLRHHRA